MTYLLDTSVWSRLDKSTVREAFERLTRAGRVAICRPVMLEILGATRTADYDDVTESLSAHPVVRVHDGTYLRASEIQHQLAIRSQHRGISTTDLLGAAAAEEVDATVVHYDGDFDVITRSDRSDHPVDRAGRHRRLTSAPCSTNRATMVDQAPVRQLDTDQVSRPPIP